MKALNLLIILVIFTGILSCQKDNSPESTDPTGWFKAGNKPEQYKIGYDEQDPKQGLKSGFIQSTEDTITDYSTFGTLMQFCSEKDFKGKRVKMTGYIKTYGYENTYATMWVRVDDYDKRVIADFDNMMDRPIVSTKPWTQCVIVFDVPESQCTINYGLILLGNGKAWIDKLSFDTVSIATFKTAYYLDEPLGEVQLPQNLPEGPVNLDFEE